MKIFYHISLQIYLYKMGKIFVEKYLYRYIEQKLSKGIIIRNSEWNEAIRITSLSYYFYVIYVKLIFGRLIGDFPSHSIDTSHRRLLLKTVYTLFKVWSAW